LTDGPFAETRKQLGGFFLINAQDLDAAIAIAAQIQVREVGTVEIHPVVKLRIYRGVSVCSPQLA